MNSLVLNGLGWTAQKMAQKSSTKVRLAVFEACKALYSFETEIIVGGPGENRTGLKAAIIRNPLGKHFRSNPRRNSATYRSFSHGLHRSSLDRVGVHWAHKKVRLTVRLTGQNQSRPTISGGVFARIGD